MVEDTKANSYFR